MEPLDLLKGTGDPAFALNAQGRITGWNRPAERLFGCRAAVALGRPCHEVLRCRDLWGSAPTPECPVVRSARQGQAVPPGGVLFAHTLRSRREGLRLTRSTIAFPRSAEARVVVLLHPSPGGVVGPDPDAGESALPDPDLTPFLDQVLALTGADAAELFLTDPTGKGRLMLVAHQGLFPRAFRQVTEFSPGQGFPGLVAQTGKPLLCSDVARDQRYLRLEVKRRGFRSYLCVPLRGVTGFLGSLHLVSRQELGRTATHLHLLGQLAGELAGVIELGRLRVTERLAGGLARGGPGESLEETAALVLSTLVDASRADGGAVLVEVGEDRPWVAAARGISPRRREFLARACDLGRCSVVKQSGGLTARPVPGRDGRADPPCLATARRWARIACLPLEAGDRRVGSVLLWYRGRDPLPGRRFVFLHGALRWGGALVEERVRQTGGAREAAGRSSGRGPEVSRTASRLVSPGRNGYPLLDIRCLGPFRVFSGGRAIPPRRFTRRRSLLLLKVLLTRYGRPVHRDELIELLSPGADARTGRRLLNVAVHYLRRALEEATGGEMTAGPVVREGETYLFDTAFPHRIDVQDFLEADRLGAELEAAGDAGGALAAVRSAAGLYRGDLLEDEPYSDWCAVEREYLRQVFMGVLQRGARLHAARGEVDQAAGYYRRALRWDETLEEVHRALMMLLWRAGRREEALRQYEACRSVLARELQTAPSPETERLRLRIVADPRPSPPLHLS